MKDIDDNIGLCMQHWIIGCNATMNKSEKRYFVLIKETFAKVFLEYDDN